MTTTTRILLISSVLALVPGLGRPADTDLERDSQQWNQAGEPAPQPVEPSSALPAQPPPPPPATAQAGVPDQQAIPPGQWVYTSQYGWIWMPYGNSYVYVASGADPLMYLYYPAVGWCWAVAPWVWGWGAMPYFGVVGPWRYGWYGHGFGRWYGYAGPYARWAGRGYWYGGRWHGDGYGHGYGPARGYAPPYRGGAPVPPRAGPPAQRWGAQPVPPRSGAPASHPGGYAVPHGGGHGSAYRGSFVSSPRGAQPSARATFTSGHGGYAAARGGFAATRGGSGGGVGVRGGFGSGRGSGGHHR
jgi:hypothetical protein